MIPREILKKNRQIKLRPNRSVTAFATGAWASARFTARTIATSKINPVLNSIRTARTNSFGRAEAETLTNPDVIKIIRGTEMINMLPQLDALLTTYE